MASYLLSKSKKLVSHNLKSHKSFIPFITHSSSITNSQLNHRHHLISSISPPPLLDQKKLATSLLTTSLFTTSSLVTSPRWLHTATSAVDQLDFPGGKVKFTPHLKFISRTDEERVPCYRVLNENGQPIIDIDSLKISKELALKMYTDMVTLQVMDTIFYEAQRQGRISFYLTVIGEEAINIASAAALNIDDYVFPQYREAGVLLYRGFTLQQFAHQLFGNKYDYGKGKQMPIHYGSNKLNYFTVASTVG